MLPMKRARDIPPETGHSGKCNAAVGRHVMLVVHDRGRISVSVRIRWRAGLSLHKSRRAPMWKR